MGGLERIEGHIAVLEGAIERDWRQGMEVRARQYEAAVRRLKVRCDVMRRDAEQGDEPRRRRR